MAEDNKNVRVTLKDVRLSYPHLFKKQAFKDGLPKFSAVFIIDPGTKQGKSNVKAMQDAIAVATKAGWPGKNPKFTPDKLCFRDGDEDRPETEGMMTAHSSNQKRPAVFDRRKQPLTEYDGKPYGGCYVNAIITVYPSTEYKGVFASLEGVQFLRDGDAFGAPPLSEDAFEDLGDEEESDDEV